MGYTREYDRLGLDEASYELLGLKVPLIKMPVATGTQPGDSSSKCAARNSCCGCAASTPRAKLAARLDASLAPGLTKCAAAAHPPRCAGRGRGAWREQVATLRELGTLHRPHGFIGLGQIAGHSRARGSRLLLRRQPAGVAAAGDGELAERQDEHNRVAVVMDIREPRFVSDFPRAYRKLKTNKHLATKMIFLEAATPSWCAASAKRGARTRSRPIGR
jgi:hypothetical protein